MIKKTNDYFFFLATAQFAMHYFTLGVDGGGFVYFVLIGPRHRHHY